MTIRLTISPLVSTQTTSSYISHCDRFVDSVVHSLGSNKETLASSMRGPLSPSPIRSEITVVICGIKRYQQSVYE